MNVDAFFDELSKLAARLNKKERRGQAAQFAGLGAAAMPLAQGLSNVIQTGKLIPKGIKPGRWLAGNIVSGALAGGAVPAIRHAIERKSQEKARTRRKESRLAG